MFNVPDVVDFADDCLVIEGVTLIFESSDSDLTRLVDQVHAEQFPRSRRFVPSLDVSFARDSSLDGPLVLIRGNAGNGSDGGTRVCGGRLSWSQD